MLMPLSAAHRWRRAPVALDVVRDGAVRGCAASAWAFRRTVASQTSPVCGGMIA